MSLVINADTDPVDYELLPTSEQTQTPQMGREEQFLKAEGRQGDLFAKYTALVNRYFLAK